MFSSMSSPVEFISYKSITQSMNFQSEDYTFFYILKGEVSVEKNDSSEVYGIDDFLILIPRETYVVTPRTNSTILFLGLSVSFMQCSLKTLDIPIFDSRHLQDQDCDKIRQLILAISDYKDNISYETNLTVTGLVFLLLAEIEKQPSFIAENKKETRNQERFYEIAAYINRHLNEPLSLSKLAKTFYLTPQYLSAAFHNYFSVTFKSYLTGQRLIFAAADLRSSDMKINEIALRNGFSGISSFRRNFVSTYHTSPAAYRKEYTKKNRKNSDSILLLSDPVTEKASNRTIQSSLELNATTKITCHSRSERMINIGSAINLTKEKYRKHLIEFHKTVQFTYIRMQEVISSSFLPMLPDYHYYIQNADIAFTFMYKTGFIPFIELSHRPFSYSVGRLNYSDLISVQHNYRYYKMLECFLIYISQGWPLSWLKQWKFELWMSPEDTVKNYLSDFKKIQLLIQKYLPGAVLGGPGYCPCFSKATPDQFLSEVRNRNVNIGFFSIYLTLLVSREADDGTYLVVNPDEDMPRKTCREIKNKLHVFNPALPLYVTEWTSVDINDTPILFSRYQAAYIARTIILLDQYSDLSAYWYFCDSRQMSLRAAEQSSCFIFEKGLTSLESSPSAPYYSYLLCNRLDSNTIMEGKNYKFTKSGNNHYHLLICHYEHFCPGSANSLCQPPQFDHLYSLFIKGSDIHSVITITNLKPGLYHVHRLLLDEFHGSMLDIMIGEFTHSKIDVAEFLQKMKAPVASKTDYLTQACVPEERIAYATSDGSLKLTADLPSHTVCLWDIQLQV